MSDLRANADPAKRPQVYIIQDTARILYTFWGRLRILRTLA